MLWALEKDPGGEKEDHKRSGESCHPDGRMHQVLMQRAQECRQRDFPFEFSVSGALVQEPAGLRAMIRNKYTSRNNYTSSSDIVELLTYGL